MDRSDLAARMKQYESVSRNYLTRKVPVIIRVDGKAFHSFTKGMKRPFDDDILLESMRQTMKYMCENIQGCVFGYTQSDEITLVLQDYKTIHTQPWFEYNVQKCTSVAASMATMIFNESMSRIYSRMYRDKKSKGEPVDDLAETYAFKCGRALFDARIFNVPKDDVCNNLIWRQQDATRNSIQQVGQANFSHRELQNKSCNEIQDMLMTQKGINWNDFPVHLKRGSCCVKESYFIPESELCIKSGITPNLEPRIPGSNELGVWRSTWNIDKNIPIFTKDREYVEKRILL